MKRLFWDVLVPLGLGVVTWCAINKVAQASHRSQHVRAARLKAQAAELRAELRHLAEQEQKAANSFQLTPGTFPIAGVGEA